jgi:hypothetical protein
MPDPTQILEALGLSVVVAAVILPLSGWPWRMPRPGRTRIGGIVGVGAGIYVGCWWLGVWPNWPPREDQDRLLFILLPAVMVVEILGALVARPRWVPWLLRLAVAAAAGPCLLYGSSYLSELAGPGSREWTSVQMAFVLAGLAMLLALGWVSAWMLVQRTACRSIPIVLALVSAGAAVAIMLSGYASGGQIGLAIGAAIVGGVIGSLPSRTPQMNGIVGLGVVGLFGLLVAGRFFGQLSTFNAVLLWCAPVLAWIAELPLLRRGGPRARGVTRVCFCSAPVVIAVLAAQHQFQIDASQTTAGANQPAADDYSAFGK